MLWFDCVSAPSGGAAAVDAAELGGAEMYVAVRWIQSVYILDLAPDENMSVCWWGRVTESHRISRQWE